MLSVVTGKKICESKDRNTEQKQLAFHRPKPVVWQKTTKRPRPTGRKVSLAHANLTRDCKALLVTSLVRTTLML